MKKNRRRIEPRQRARPPKWELLESRQLFSTATEAPFLGSPFLPNQSIAAVNYDKGGEGIAYHDTTPANLGGNNYRPGDAVDIETGGPSGKAVGHTAAGEYLNYTVTLPTTGYFTFQANTSNPQSGATLHASINGINLTGALAEPATGGWTTFKTVGSSKFLLGAGTWVLHISLDKASANSSVGNLDSFKLIPAASPTPTPTPTPTSTFPSQLNWSTLASAPLARIEANAETVGGKVYVFGGYNTIAPDYVASKELDIYDSASNTWSRGADMPEGITHLGTANDGRYIYTAGGYVTNYTTSQQTHGSTDVWKYDTVTNTWSAFVPLPQPRGSGGMVMIGTVLHYFDGYNLSMVAQTSHWMLDLSSANPQWISAAPVPKARTHVTATALNGKIYVIGGEPGNTEGQPTTDVFMWDPASPGAWKVVASLPVARTTAVSVGINGKIIVTGGLTANFTPLATVVVYDPTTNIWTQINNPLPAPRERPVATILNDRLFISTGYQNGIHADTWISQPLG